MGGFGVAPYGWQKDVLATRADMLAVETRLMRRMAMIVVAGVGVADAIVTFV